MGTILYDISQILYNIIGYWGAILIPFFIIIPIIIFQIKKFSFNFVILVAIFSLFPALTPAMTQIFGYDVFSMLNHDLQQDRVLKIAATFLISIFCASFIFGSRLPNKINYFKDRPRYVLPIVPVVVIFSSVFLLLLLFLETGNIITTGYGEIKSERSAPYSSLVNQFFNVCAAIFLCYIGGFRRQRFIFIFYILLLVFLLVVSRRTMALGIFVIFIYCFASEKFSVKQIILMTLLLSVLLFIGEARSVGVINFVQGARPEAAAVYFYSLPGGATNIFVGTMGVIDLQGRGSLHFPESIPILLWPSGVYEFNIYSSFSYDYNGGMHIVNIFYWNFGLLGVIFGGIVLGWLTMRVHLIARRLKYEMGGTIAGMLSFGFILLWPNFFWYHPVGLIKLSVAILIGFGLLSMIKGEKGRRSYHFMT